MNTVVPTLACSRMFRVQRKNDANNELCFDLFTLHFIINYNQCLLNLQFKAISECLLPSIATTAILFAVSASSAIIKKFPKCLYDQ